MAKLRHLCRPYRTDREQRREFLAGAAVGRDCIAGWGRAVKADQEGKKTRNATHRQAVGPHSSLSFARQAGRTTPRQTGWLNLTKGRRGPSPTERTKRRRSDASSVKGTLPLYPVTAKCQSAENRQDRRSAEMAACRGGSNGRSVSRKDAQDAKQSARYARDWPAWGPGADSAPTRQQGQYAVRRLPLLRIPSARIGCWRSMALSPWMRTASSATLPHAEITEGLAR